MLTKLAGGRIAEVPVHYGQKIGESKITGSFKKSIKVGINMLGIILKYKLNPPKMEV